MPPCVIDTDVVSFLFKNSSLARLYNQHLTGRLLIVSFVTVAELDRWALDRNWGLARTALMEAHLQQFVVHPSDRNLCRQWAQVINSERRNGRVINTADAWVAATALLNNIPLVSHNRRHFENVEGLDLISEA
jgi:predicted nucleic acid-binding protein